MAIGVRALLEYLTTVPQIVGTLVWVSAMKAAVTLSASRLGNEVGRVLKTQHMGVDNFFVVGGGGLCCHAQFCNVPLLLIIDITKSI